MTTASPQHARPGALAAGRLAFRRWRRSRPFWGGLFTALGGLEIFGTTQMSLGGLTFQMGPTGFLSWLIPTILVACGMLMWFTPQQRMFYAIVGAMTAVFSLIAVNLGGFFLGLLLGMLGGGLGFAWVPARTPTPPAGSEEPEPVTATEWPGPDPAPATRPPEPVAGERRPEPDPGTATERPEPAAPVGGTEPAGPDPRLLGVILLVSGLAIAGLVTLDRAAPAQAAPCPPAVGASPPASRPVPGGTTASPSASPSATPGGRSGDGGGLLGDIVDGIGDGLHRLLGGGNEPQAPAPTATPPAVRPAGSPTPAPSVPSGRPIPRTGACAPGAASPTPSGSATAVPLIDPPADQPYVNKVPSLMTGTKVTMYGLRLNGIVELPKKGGGTVRALDFGMTRAVTDNFALKVPGPADRSQLLRSSALSVEGDVHFYTSRFSGKFLGVAPLTLTPDQPIPPDGIPLTVPVPVVFTDPEIDLVFVNCHTLTAPDLVHTLV
ncbi:DUF6114 domain-containing protein [Micromonospora sp. NPDC049559]|uniref:DUF6114 domain-containing protein n=1 Tax=Micromonospora sp. NPDC049559 TaxID=3155923 RepID=UPI003418D06D